MRTKKNKIFNCIITDHKGECIHNEDYFTLQEIAQDLGLSNNVIYNLSSRRRDLKYTKFKYYPLIEINKIYINSIND